MTDLIKVKTVCTASFSMDYFSFGGGSRALVILPGLSVKSVMPSAGAIAERYSPLARDFTVYVFDRRRVLPAGYSITGMARDTAEAIRALGIARASVFGASQGGMIAAELAASEPELVEALILGSSCARVTPERFRVPAEWIRLARARDAEGLYLSFGQAAYPAEIFAAARQSLADEARTVTDAELDRFVILAESVRDHSAAALLGSIRCPALVLASRDDGVFGSDAAEELCSLIPGCGLYLYTDRGHAAYDTAPDYPARMLEFLTRGSQK